MQVANQEDEKELGVAVPFRTLRPQPESHAFKTEQITEGCGGIQYVKPVDALADGQETYSGTLVATKGDAEFELKLSGGATCDASKLTGEVGLVRLPEIKCSDDRMLRALFVPQGGKELKVFGHIGDQRFASSAHLLGTEPPPVRKQTAEPTVPGMERLHGDRLS